MTKDFIVAIEIGSSKITGIAGRRNDDGSISVLALAQEDSRQSTHKGVVYNIDKTVLTIGNIIKKMENTLKTHIARVYAGIGGQSIHSEKNVITKEFDQDTHISAEIVDAMRDENSNTNYVEQELLLPISQEFMVDSQPQLDPVGIQCQTLKANFLNILCRKSNYVNLNKCFKMAQQPVAEMYLAPIALADSILTETEKRQGCILVDLGYETTTVAVYYRNIIRHLAVIPLGSNNVTKDIANFLQIEDDEAENIKLKYGSAYTDPKNQKDDVYISLADGRNVDAQRVDEIIEARMEEIIANVVYQVPSEYSNSLISGIVLTGGGANMTNMDVAFRNFTHISKIRIAKFVTFSVNSNRKEITAHDSRLNTVLGILAKGDINCAGAPIENTLFKDNDKPAEVKTEVHASDQTNTGAVLSDAAKQKAADEERKRKEKEEAEKAAAAAAEAAAEAERQRKANSPLHKIKTAASHFFDNLLKGDDE